MVLSLMYLDNSFFILINLLISSSFSFLPSESLTVEIVISSNNFTDKIKIEVFDVDGHEFCILC